LKLGRQAVERATYYEGVLLIVGLYCLGPTRRPLEMGGTGLRILKFWGLNLVPENSYHQRYFDLKFTQALPVNSEFTQQNCP
jgi:hypothetical protein